MSKKSEEEQIALDFPKEDLDLQPRVLMVPIDNIIPNTLNPREDDGEDSEVLQKIISEFGWETPITAYRQHPESDIFIIISGHRRREAAKRAGIKKVPVFERPKPKNAKEENRRIGGLQRNQINWTAYEWATYTYNLWIEWGKPERKKFANEINMNHRVVTDYINVIQYYPRSEIEDGLRKKELTITSLSALRKWMKDLMKYKPKFVEQMGEDIIRRMMIKKIQMKKAKREALRNGDYCRLATEEDIKKFLLDKNAELELELGYLGIKKKFKDFRSHMISLGHLKRRVPEMKPETRSQAEEAVEKLDELIKMLEEKREEFKNRK